ncbi:A/G-specific adenine glycosylase [Mucilaginibacter sp. PPCGB 2223]|uniref:A/G-specific adenine glycosylase n=1 Tax=Mucilaginibacter sp. PPCGB 2223 TaxID=1886027 RepID=UPI000826F9C4|nr:A/G-specific adenine glycosylase [Mucilaginibacter sp. PPCGB 2223]OCX51076.1 A/G-specific adenine glycosylase [Mucilaginibacter sp. PPCGB 2223]
MNFNQSLAQWYRHNRRDLPWRNTTDPYVIWLSEIILQQTRVEQGKPYFYRFAEAYPTVTHFAAATEDEVLKLWQGLGYYSRGRNMLTTARLVQQKFGGVFPGNYDDLIALKGIGEYTAAAISSFSTNQAKAVVDGNVSRVIARYFGIAEPINSTKGKKLFQQMANELLDPAEPGLHNQAMMEFGAMLCRPRNPLCDACPVRTGCYALQHNQVNQLPVKLKTVKIRKRYFNYWLIIDNGEVLLNKRGETDIWASMYDLPLTETAEDKSVEELLASPETLATLGFTPQIKAVYPTQKHILTHQHIYYRFIYIQNNLKIKLKPSWFFLKVENLNNLALPKIIFLFLTKFFEL